MIKWTPGLGPQMQIMIQELIELTLMFTSPLVPFDDYEASSDAMVDPES